MVQLCEMSVKFGASVRSWAPSTSTDTDPRATSTRSWKGSRGSQIQIETTSMDPRNVSPRVVELASNLAGARPAPDRRLATVRERSGRDVTAHVTWGGSQARLLQGRPET